MIWIAHNRTQKETNKCTQYYWIDEEKLMVKAFPSLHGYISGSFFITRELNFVEKDKMLILSLKWIRIAHSDPISCLVQILGKKFLSHIKWYTTLYLNRFSYDKNALNSCLVQRLGLVSFACKMICYSRTSHQTIKTFLEGFAWRQAIVLLFLIQKLVLRIWTKNSFSITTLKNIFFPFTCIYLWWVKDTLYAALSHLSHEII